MHLPPWAGLLVCVLVGEAGCRSSHRGPPEGRPAELSNRTTTPNGLVAIPYPAGFTVVPVTSHVVRLEENHPGGYVDMLTVTALPGPFSVSVEELAKIMEPSGGTTFPNWIESKREPATCVGQPGIAVLGTWRTDQGTAYRRRVCVFLWSKHGVSVAYSVAASADAARETRLRTIADAVELVR